MVLHYLSLSKRRAGVVHIYVPNLIIEMICHFQGIKLVVYQQGLSNKPVVINDPLWVTIKRLLMNSQ